MNFFDPKGDWLILHQDARPYGEGAVLLGEEAAEPEGAAGAAQPAAGALGLADHAGNKVEEEGAGKDHRIEHPRIAHSRTHPARNQLKDGGEVRSRVRLCTPATDQVVRSLSGQGSNRIQEEQPSSITPL